MATSQMSEKMSEKIEGVESVIGYDFQDPLILWEALQAAGSGVTSAGTRRFPDGNKRLAILGNKILELCLVITWYNGAGVRGNISEIVQRVGSNANLDRAGRIHGLDAFICRNPAQGDFVSPATMTATVEAILGAVYMDSDVDSTINGVSQVMQALGLVVT